MKIRNQHGTDHPVRAQDRRVAKLLGADVELGNFIEGTHDLPTGRMASRMILREVPGISRSYVCLAQDSFRKFLPDNGGSAYIDLDHAEFPIPEVGSAARFRRRLACHIADCPVGHAGR